MLFDRWCGCCLVSHWLSRWLSWLPRTSYQELCGFSMALSSPSNWVWASRLVGALFPPPPQQWETNSYDWIGSKLAFWEYREDECEVLSSWFHLIWVPVFSISANILLSSHPKHWPSMSAAATLSYAISFLTSRILNVGYVSSTPSPLPPPPPPLLNCCCGCCCCGV